MISFMKKKKRLFFLLLFTLMITTIVFISTTRIGAKKVFAAGNELKITVDNVNVIVDFSEDEKFHCRYNHSLYIVKRKQKDSSTVISLKRKKGKLKKKEIDTADFIKVSIPNKTYTKITGIAKNAGLSMPSANANIIVKNYSSAVNLTLPTRFHKKIKYIGKDGSGSIAMNGNNKFMIDVEVSNTALSTFWGGDSSGDAIYQYQHGDGKRRPKIQLNLEDCAFSIVEK